MMRRSFSDEDGGRKIMGLVAIIIILGAIAVAGIVGGMVWGISHPLAPGKETKAIKGSDGKPVKVISNRKEQKQLMGANGFSYLDAEAGATGDDIRAVLEPFREDEVIGNHAGCTHTAIGRAEFARDGIVSLMEREFGRDSLTWEKFSVPVEAALGSIYSNSARIANIVQAFDSNEYQRLQRLDKAGQLSEGGQQARRLETMSSQLREAHDLVYDNEAMLDELGRLQTELAKLADSHQAVTSGDIAEEVRNLADATKQYMPDASGTDLSDFDLQPSSEVPIAGEASHGIMEYTEGGDADESTEPAGPSASATEGGRSVMMAEDDAESLWH